MQFKQSLKDTYINKHILWALAVKQLKAKYSGSRLGIWWAIILPFMIMGVISFIFTKVISVDIDRFPLFCLAGLLSWFFFSVSLSDATPSFITGARMVKQFSFPLEFIPMASVLANFINFIFGLVVMLPIFIIFNADIISGLSILPVVLVLHLLFTAGLALILSCVNIFFRDISQLLGVILMFWFWLTPIFYSVEMVPVQYRWIYMLNPLAIFINIYRDILFDATLPSLAMGLSAFFISIIVFVTGWVLVIAHKDFIVKKI